MTEIKYFYSPVSGDEAEIAQIAKLFSTVWPKAHHLDERYICWLYLENPVGPVIGINAWYRDHLAGHYAVIPIQANLKGEQIPAAVSLNTAVHPQHQRRGLFTKLAESTYELARSQGINHIVGVANANSTPGFLKRLRFQLVAPLSVWVLWGSVSCRRDYLRDKQPLWEHKWTESTFRWRLSNPSRAYRFKNSGGCVECLAPTGEFGIHALLKVEADPNLVTIAQNELPYLRLQRPKVWIGLSEMIRMPRPCAISLPKRFRRSPLNLVFRSLTDKSEHLDARHVEFALLDFDAY